jgi:hypothetical protein
MVGVPSALCVQMLQEQAWSIAAAASAAQAYRSNGLAAVRGLVHVVGGSVRRWLSTSNGSNIAVRRCHTSINYCSMLLLEHHSTAKTTKKITSHASTPCRLCRWKNGRPTCESYSCLIRSPIHTHSRRAPGQRCHLTGIDITSLQVSSSSCVIPSGNRAWLCNS